MPEYPPIESLLPHTGPIVLLRRVLAHAERETVCEVVPTGDDLLADAAGRVPAWVGIEYMAQCVAAHSGMLARVRGVAPRPGFLVASRRIDLHAAELVPDRALWVRARHVWGEHEGMVSFDCTVSDAVTGAALVSGRLSCLLPAADDPILRDPSGAASRSDETSAPSEASASSEASA